MHNASKGEQNRTYYTYHRTFRQVLRLASMDNMEASLKYIQKCADRFVWQTNQPARGNL